MDEQQQTQEGSVPKTEAEVKDLAPADQKGVFDELEQAAEQAAQKAEEAVVKFVHHAEAMAMFEANAGIGWIRTKLGDGRIGDLSRHGEFRAIAADE